MGAISNLINLIAAVIRPSSSDFASKHISSKFDMVDENWGEILVSGKKKLKIKKYPDMSGRGLNLLFTRHTAIQAETLRLWDALFHENSISNETMRNIQFNQNSYLTFIEPCHNACNTDNYPTRLLLADCKERFFVDAFETLQYMSDTKVYGSVSWSFKNRF